LSFQITLRFLEMPKARNYNNVHFHFLKKDFSLRNRDKLKVFINDLFEKEKKVLDNLDYIFCSDAYLLKINKDYLEHNFYTDIITFDLSSNTKSIFGEIYISTDRVKENAILYKTSFTQELYRVLFHGCLHLCGFKDKSPTQSKKMRKKEDEYLSLFFK
jgi:probable rRNA maturation factor